MCRAQLPLGATVLAGSLHPQPRGTCQCALVGSVRRRDTRGEPECVIMARFLWNGHPRGGGLSPLKEGGGGFWDCKAAQRGHF